MFLHFWRAPVSKREQDQAKKLVKKFDLIFCIYNLCHIPDAKLWFNRQTNKCHNSPIVLHLETEHLFRVFLTKSIWYPPCGFFQSHVWRKNEGKLHLVSVSVDGFSNKFRLLGPYYKDISID